MNQSTETISQGILQIGHTPDPDDAFMFYGMATQQVDIPGHRIESILEDIETLNKMALAAEIDVTAISAAQYPRINNNYWILPVGASVGRGYGPIIVKKKGGDPKGKKIGIPGLNTTAFLLLQLFNPGMKSQVYRFDEIPKAVLEGKVDYGLLIHEAQLVYSSEGLDLVKDLGKEWASDTGLPLPLGIDVIKKNLGSSLAKSVSEALKKSIEVALAQKEKAVSYAQKFARGQSLDLVDRFTAMYVNRDTLDMPEDVEKALNLLFDKGYRAGIFRNPTVVDVIR